MPVSRSGCVRARKHLADGARVAVEHPELEGAAAAAEARQHLAHQLVAGDRRRRLRADRARGPAAAAGVK